MTCADPVCVVRRYVVAVVFLHVRVCLVPLQAVVVCFAGSPTEQPSGGENLVYTAGAAATAAALTATAASQTAPAPSAWGSRDCIGGGKWRQRRSAGDHGRELAPVATTAATAVRSGPRGACPPSSVREARTKQNASREGSNNSNKKEG